MNIYAAEQRQVSDWRLKRSSKAGYTLGERTPNKQRMRTFANVIQKKLKKSQFATCSESGRMLFTEKMNK